MSSHYLQGGVPPLRSRRSRQRRSTGTGRLAGSRSRSASDVDPAYPGRPRLRPSCVGSKLGSLQRQVVGSQQQAGPHREAGPDGRRQCAGRRIWSLRAAGRDPLGPVSPSRLPDASSTSGAGIMLGAFSATQPLYLVRSTMPKLQQSRNRQYLFFQTY
jgi:hypothetical protein